MSEGPPDTPAEFVRWMRQVNDDELREVLAEQRTQMLDGLFAAWASLPAPSSMDGVIEWRIGGREDGGADHFQTAMANRVCAVTRDGDATPGLVVEIDAIDLLRVAARIVMPSALFSRGGMVLDGDLKLAAQLDGWFRMIGSIYPEPGSGASTQ